jgi:hypothetical protein
LRAFVGAHGADATASNDNDFTHKINYVVLLSRKFTPFPQHCQKNAFFSSFDLDCLLSLGCGYACFA